MPADSLRELLSQAFTQQQASGASILSALGRDSTPDLPRLPDRPAAWEPDVPVLGSPALARLVWALTNEDPSLKRTLHRGVSSGPTPGVITRLARDNFKPEDFDKTSLLGMFEVEPDFGRTFIRPGLPLADEPRLDSPTLIQTLIHELTHAKGGDELAARAAETSKQTRRKYPALLSIARR